MTPRRPYMVRAVYEWILDNQLTPFLVVDAEIPGCQLPWEFVQDGQIVLNVTPTAVANLLISNDQLSFNARFSGKPHQVVVPMAAVLALYARENGAGSLFEHEPGYDIPAENNPVESSSVSAPKASASHLKVVK